MSLLLCVFPALLALLVLLVLSSALIKAMVVKSYFLSITTICIKRTVVAIRISTTALMLTVMKNCEPMVLLMRLIFYYDRYGVHFINMTVMLVMIIMRLV